LRSRLSGVRKSPAPEKTWASELELPKQKWLSFVNEIAVGETIGEAVRQRHVYAIPAISCDRNVFSEIVSFGNLGA
jgi:hypothetical protein